MRYSKSLLFVLLLLLASRAEAKMVSYYDEKGEVHYINTDYMPVPPQYMRQVQPQLEEPTPAPTEKASKNTNLSPTPTPFVPPPDVKPGTIVEFFTSIDCKICTQVEILMRAKGVKFYSYDVNYHPRGRQFLEEKGEKLSLPVIRVNGKEVEGCEITTIMQAIEKADNAK